MDLILNEFLHEHHKDKLDSYFKVIYEPCENSPAKNLTGMVYSGTKLTQTFYLKNEREIAFTTIGKPKNKALFGYFVPTEKTPILYWEKDPGEHCLCVSYEFSSKQLSELSINWHQEGF
jgi:hypothetical protein